jgi:toxin-antitoxin system PIN domain toxin
MILPDVNLLVYAYSEGVRSHTAARRWWEDCLSGTEQVALPWVVILGFLRIATNRRIFDNALPVTTAIRHIRSWLECSHVEILHPGPRHADLVLSHIERLGTAGDLTTDAHLAALAQEFQAILHTADADFARFPGVRCVNPLARRR